MRSSIAAAHPARPLGSNEKAFWRLSESSPLNFAVLARVRPGLDPDRVRGALAALQTRHPLLRARIERRGADPWFVWPDAPPAIPLEVQTVDHAAWKPPIEDALRRVVAWDQAPLARALLLDHGDGATLVLLFHHSTADGVGATYAVRDLLWHATTGATHSPAVHARSVAAESALPARSRGLRGGLKRLGVLAGIATAGRQPPLRYPMRRFSAPHERTFHTDPVDLDEATTAALAARARATGSSVHGAISAALLFAVARAAGLDGERTVALGSPINVRDQLSPPVGEQLGMYLGVSQFRGAVAPSTRFWDLARAIRARITDDVETGRAVDSLPLMELFYRALGGTAVSPQEFGRKWAESNGTTGVTNVGRIEMPAPPGVTIDHVQPIGFPSGLDVFNVLASSWNGRLLAQLNWSEPGLDRAGAMALIADMDATLRAAAAGDPILGR